MKNKPSSQILPLDELEDSELQVMYKLFSEYYGACDFSLFQQDIKEKDYVLLLKDDNDQICGFSTLMVINFSIGGNNMRAIFSGDTIIHHKYWGSQALSIAWCQMAGKIKAEQPHTPLYWLLIVKGYRTYRYLPLFAKKFYPTWRSKTPNNIQKIIDHLATKKYGGDYDSKNGIIRFKQSRGHLKGKWADIPEHVNKHKDVEFFLKNNPGYASGSELVCLTELEENNLRSFALRAFTEASAT